jgi:lipopolysaccharide/colanic/teichoic acid biosynthesis glycosyltransferase
MVPGADALLEYHLRKNPEARREWDETQKLKNDPRITRIGAFLRKSSLDELPQLWNVLRGEMSLVGPRPMMVDQRTLYPGTAYFDLRPGITGLWQISERNETSFAERAVFDNRYLASLSLSLDVSILLRTVSVVLRGTGY